MKILQITPESPSPFSGGGIGIIQSLLSLIQSGYTVDYVGPKILDNQLSSLYNKTFFLEPSNNLALRFYDSLFMNTNQRYRSWLNLNIDLDAYDIIYMDFTKLHYVLNRIKNKPLIVRVHNVEKDYSYNNYLHHKNLVNFFDNIFAGPREKLIANHANRLIALTEKDKKRLCDLYHIPADKISIIPVCVSNPNTSINHITQRIISNSQTLNILITGSLWYGSNYEGILWFLKFVYAKLTINRHLCIAGAHPTPELKNFVANDPTITLIDTPPDISPYFKAADIFVAPIFDGAGMKVKVAEALSFGLPVIGTSHAFEGYDITDQINSYLADNDIDFINKIEQYFKLSPSYRLKVQTAALDLYSNKYSLNSSAAALKKIIDSAIL